ncbi:MAG: hypothetical protein M1169_08845 [Firmicutes bacterium]|nr:hypothetical protein [Bacillota bacterium]
MSFNFSELNRNNRLVVLLLVAIIAILLFTRPLKAQTGPHLIKATGIELYTINGREVGGFTSTPHYGSNLWMRDGRGNVRVAISIQPNGVPVMMLISPNGNRAIITPH